MVPVSPQRRTSVANSQKQLLGGSEGSTLRLSTYHLGNLLLVLVLFLLLTRIRWGSRRLLSWCHDLWVSPHQVTGWLTVAAEISRKRWKRWFPRQLNKISTIVLSVQLYTSLLLQY